MPELEKVKCSTPELAEETVKKILAVVPECEGEKGIIDFDKLKQCLSSKVIEGNVERYEFTWPGKRAAKAAASAATTKTLRPCAAESVGKDGTPGGFNSQNLYIEGDNLEVLKLLQTSYANQVKMIYIDPPYNLGHDQLYRDRFSLTQKEVESEAGVFDDDGNRFMTNDSADARYHTNWCSSIYPRLKLARRLLSEDGVIFISIDEHESANLRKITEEIFFDSNFLAEIVWESTTQPTNAGSAKFKLQQKTEHILVYAKNKVMIPGFHLYAKDSTLAYPHHGRFGKCRFEGIEKSDAGGYARPTMRFAILGQYPRAGKRWQVGLATARELEQSGKVEIVDGEVKKAVYPEDEADKIQYEPFWSLIHDEKLLSADDVDSAMDGKDELNELMGTDIGFDTVKPTRLMQKLLFHVTDKDSLILDFFSGSATTAHAMLKLNAKDGGNRKFILVQLPEICAEDSAAVKAGYKNICEIGKERLRRAGKKISEENATNAVNLDVGFRVLKLSSSSLRDTSATVSETTQEFANFERIKSDRTPEDLLFQMLLETRIPLSDPIETKKVGDNNVFFVSGNALVACLDPAAKMTTEFFIEIAKLKPGIAFFRDDAFADDSARTNLQQAFDQFSPTTSIKVI